MHDRNSGWRGRLPANAGTLGGALLACLCAGQLTASAPAPSTAAAATTRATGTVAGSAPAGSATPMDPTTDARVIAAARGRAEAAHATRAASRAKRLTASRSANHPDGASRTTTQRPTASTAERIIGEARRHIGAPYEFGASGPTTFDCSGFTAYVFGKVAGIDLPHKADSQQEVGRAVSRSAARPGDLIVFLDGSYGYHVGIYAGSGYMYDSPRSGETVGKHEIWSDEYVVRRLLG